MAGQKQEPGRSSVELVHPELRRRPRKRHAPGVGLKPEVPAPSAGKQPPNTRADGVHAEMRARALQAARRWAPRGQTEAEAVGSSWPVRASGNGPGSAGRFHPPQAILETLDRTQRTGSWVSTAGRVCAAWSHSRVPYGLGTGWEGRGEVECPRMRQLQLNVRLFSPHLPSLHHVYWALTKCQAALGAGAAKRNAATQVASKLGVEIQITIVQPGERRARGKRGGCGGGASKPKWEGETREIREGFPEEVTFC